MFKTLYKRSHAVAIGISAALMITASAAAGAAAVMHDHLMTAREAQAAPVVGRFVVTPATTQFIPAAETTH